MIKIDMLMPKQCESCRFCAVKYTDDNMPDSYAYCYAVEKFIAHACDGTDKVVANAILGKQSWCPLMEQEPKEVDEWPDEFLCPTCKTRLAGHGSDDSVLLDTNDTPNFCWVCGQAVKWDG